MTEYYYLNETPAKAYEYLIAPGRLADRWKDEATRPNDMNLCQRVAKIVASYFIHLLSIPLGHAAELVNKKFRTAIPEAVFAERKQYWDKIVHGIQAHKDSIVKELIRAQIPDTKYTKIFWALAFNFDHNDKIIPAYFDEDWYFPHYRDTIRNDVDGGPYLLVSQGRMKAKSIFCQREYIHETTDVNIQAAFKDMKVKELNRHFRQEVMDKFHYLITFTNELDCYTYECLRSLDVRNSVATMLAR